MNEKQSAVFLYGLFMDQALLAGKGVACSVLGSGYLEGFALRIGERATLVRDPGSRAYGLLMLFPAGDVSALYSDASVADYVPESVVVTMENGDRRQAICFNLPDGDLAAANPTYAGSLLRLCRELGFPDEYLAEIARQGRPRTGGG